MDDQESEFENYPECTCRKNDCEKIICRGECGCERCKMNYADFLSCE